MIQKIFSITIALVSLWAIKHFDSLMPIIVIVIAFAIYRGANHGLWFRFGRASKSQGDFQERDYSNFNGGGD